MLTGRQREWLEIIRDAETMAELEAITGALSSTDREALGPDISKAQTRIVKMETDVHFMERTR